jgi:hypothetical protein
MIKIKELEEELEENREKKGKVFYRAVNNYLLNHICVNLHKNIQLIEYVCPENIIPDPTDLNHIHPFREHFSMGAHHSEPGATRKEFVEKFYRALSRIDILDAFAGEISNFLNSLNSNFLYFMDMPDNVPFLTKYIQEGDFLLRYSMKCEFGSNEYLGEIAFQVASFDKMPCAEENIFTGYRNLGFECWEEDND